MKSCTLVILRMALGTLAALFVLVHPGQAPTSASVNDPLQGIVECVSEGREIVVVPKLQCIVECLSRSEEIVMAPTLRCVERRKGDAIAERDGMPLGINLAAACSNKNDPRRLPPDIIKRVAKSAQVGSSGIRIIGALFCDGIDLIGVDIPYSLILDRAAVKGSLDARNLNVRGDFSFEYAVILGNLRLNRAHVSGSVYGGAAFMRRLRVHDSQIEGSWHQQNGIVFLDAFIIRNRISGDLDFRDSAFSRLLVRSSQIGGTVALDNSEARCSYHISASTLGYLTADNAGFGAARRVIVGKEAVDFTWWSRARSRTTPDNSYKREVFRSPAVRPLVKAEFRRVKLRALFEASQRSGSPHEADVRIPGCKDETPIGSKRTTGLEGLPGSPYLEFYVFETTVRSALCLKSLAWPLPARNEFDDAHPVTILALNGSQVSGNAVIDLWSAASSRLAETRRNDPNYEKIARKHKFEVIGLSAGALIYDFSDNDKPYVTYLDGLKFDRVHKAAPDCRSESISKVATQVDLPSVDDVVRWLNKNTAASSQPFDAFVDAFSKSGGSTTELRVARKSADLCRHIMAWLPNVNLSLFCAMSYQAESDATGLAPVRATMTSVISGTADFIATGFESLLWAVADHGYRPGKVVGPILTLVIVFWLLFWFVLRIVAFDPKAGDSTPEPGARKPWPIDFLFLFDRMIPLYNIRNEHYSIVRYYRRSRRTKKDDKENEPEQPAYPMKWLGFTFSLHPLNEAEAQRVENWLTFLRILGAGLTIFLIAAIGALTQ